MGKIRVDDEISLPEVYLRLKSFKDFLLSKWLTLTVFLLVFALIGLVYSISQQYRYEASQTLLTYTNTNAGNQTASRLASLAGINLPNMQGNDGQVVSEFMMPSLLSTYPVARKIGDLQVRTMNSSEPVKSIEFIINENDDTIFTLIGDWTIGLPVKIINGIFALFQDKPSSVSTELPEGVDSSESTLNSVEKNKTDTGSFDLPEHLVVSGFERNALNKLTNSIDITVDANMITISVELSDPYVAADLVSGATNVLMQEVVNFQIKKTEEELEFIEGLLAEAETEYQNSLNRISVLQDRQRGITSNTSQIELNIAMGESELARQRYMQFLLRVEDTKVRLKQNTPMFAILNPVQIPVDPVNGNKTGTVLLFMILGGIVGIGYVTYSGFISHLKSVGANTNEE